MSGMSTVTISMVIAPITMAPMIEAILTIVSIMPDSWTLLIMSEPKRYPTNVSR